MNWPGPGAVLGHHHHAHLVTAAEGHGLAGRIHQEGQIPAFHVHADGAGSQEGAGLQRLEPVSQLGDHGTVEGIHPSPDQRERGDPVVRFQLGEAHEIPPA